MPDKGTAHPMVVAAKSSPMTQSVFKVRLRQLGYILSYS